MLCGVVRHTDRADCNFSVVDDEFWSNCVDSQAWPLDPPLSDDGVKAAQELGDRIAMFANDHGSGFHVVITSPYKRCIQTALEITKKLGDSTSIFVDRALGEIFNAETLGCMEQPRNVVRPVEGWQASWGGHVDCMHRAMGEWPPWGESVEDARFRYASTFLSYLRRGANSWNNFLLVTHGDGVAACLSMMPFSAGKCVTGVAFGGMFLAKAGLHGFDMTPPDHGWKSMTAGIKTKRTTGRNSLLAKAYQSNKSSMNADDIKALLSTGVHPLLLLRQKNGMMNNGINCLDDEDPLSPVFLASHGVISVDSDFEDDPTSPFLRQTSEVSQVFQRKATMRWLDSESSSQRTGSPFSRSGSKSPSQSYPSRSGSKTNVSVLGAFVDPICTVKLLQRAWWSERSVILCDGRKPGCPIVYACDGFLKLFEVTSEQCLGVPCGRLVRPDLLLEAFVWPSRQYVSKLVKDMLNNFPEPDMTGFALLLNRKQGGALFVNQLVLRTHRHPMTGEPYIIGVQDDVTSKIPVLRFLEQCKCWMSYQALLTDHEAELAEKVADLQLNCDEVINEIFSMAQEACVPDTIVERIDNNH
jgi:broad specificity phosphatase PhoE